MQCRCPPAAADYLQTQQSEITPCVGRRVVWAAEWIKGVHSQSVWSGFFGRHYLLLKSEQSPLFWPHFGRRCFYVLPFGKSSRPELSQRQMSCFSEELEGVSVSCRQEGLTNDMITDADERWDFIRLGWKGESWIRGFKVFTHSWADFAVCSITSKWMNIGEKKNLSNLESKMFPSVSEYCCCCCCCWWWGRKWADEFINIWSWREETSSGNSRERIQNGSKTGSISYRTMCAQIQASCYFILLIHHISKGTYCTI